MKVHIHDWQHCPLFPADILAYICSCGAAMSRHDDCMYYSPRHPVNYRWLWLVLSESGKRGINMIEAICNACHHVFIALVILGITGCPECGSEDTSVAVLKENEDEVEQKTNSPFNSRDRRSPAGA